MNLYRVKLAGMRTNIGKVAYGDSYVLANDPTEAYQTLKNFVDKHDLGFIRDREMESVTLLASEEKYNKIGRLVLVASTKDTSS